MGLIHRVQSPNIVTTKLDAVFNWARAWSLWWFAYGIACCAIEIMTVNTSRYELDRIGIIPRSSPRHSDFMVVAGPVTKKMEPVIKRLYDEMAEPRWVMAMGSCAISGGAFAESYNVLKGVDSILPVDVYIPGCPPRPEAFIYGIFKLREKIKTETFVGGAGGTTSALYVPPMLTPEMEREVREALVEANVEADGAVLDEGGEARDGED